MKTQLFAPEIDNFIDNINRETVPINSDIYQSLKNIYVVFSCMKPVGDDKLRETWLEVERGPIEAFGNFEEFQESGEVETLDDFDQLWKDYYPEETKWYKFQTAKYEDNLYFYFGGKLLWTINKNEFREEDAKTGWNLGYYERFAGWLLEKITDETNKLKNDADKIVHMVTGEDFIGIVPDTVFPRYCHSLFPEEDRIINFMNLGSDKEIVPIVVEKAQWYPLERIDIDI